MASKALSNDHVKIVVLGAGVAGLAAASQLVKHGFTNIVVLEAQEKIGGRVQTQKFGNSHIELGAQWIHGEVGNPVHEIAVENNFLNDSINEPVTALDAEFRTQYGELLNSHLARDFEIIMASIMEECREIALASPNASIANVPAEQQDNSTLDFFQRKYTEYLKSETDIPKATLIKDALFNWYCLFRNTVEGCDTLAEMSLKSWADYKECEGNPVIDIKTGYSSILDVLQENIPEEVISVRSPVKAIHMAKPVEGKLPEGKLPVSVALLDGEVIQAQHVISTVSLGYLKRYMNSFFYPALPENKKLAIMALGFGTVNKIYLQFEKPFWPKDSAGYSFLWLEENATDGKGNMTKLTIADTWQHAIVGFYTVTNQPDVLCGWIAGREARYMETLAESEVLETCVQVLQQFTGNTKLPKVKKIVSTAWNSQPFTLGSYSFKTYQCDEIQDAIGDLSAPLTVSLDDRAVGGIRSHPAVLFAGEATHPYYYSTVHGALLSGLREADRLITYHRAYNEEIELERSMYEKYKTVASMHRVIVMGAGISGLAAALALQEYGVTDYKILEAQSHPGGRIESVKVGSRYVEYGAQWIHGEEGNPIFELASKNNLISVDKVPCTEGEGCFFTQDGKKIDTTIIREVKAIVGQAHIDCAQFSTSDPDLGPLPVSVGEYVSEQFELYLKAYKEPEDVIRTKRGLYEWHMNYSCIDNACSDMNDLSAKLWGAYEECSGNPRISFASGYSSLISLLTEKLNPHAIIFNSAVKRIEWDKDILTSNLILSFEPQIAQSVDDKQYHHVGLEMDEIRDTFSNRDILGLKKEGRDPLTLPIEVVCENGKRYLCEHLIITSSIGCLKSTTETLFVPPLPHWKLNSIQSTGYGTVNKIFLEFAEAFWPPECKGFQFVWTDDKFTLPNINTERWYRDISGFDVIPGSPAVLLGWVGRKGAEVMETYSSDQVSAVCIAMLKHFTGMKNIPEPISIHKSAWFHNPFIRGAYSYRAIGNERNLATHRDLAEPVRIDVDNLRYPALLFAGEATDMRYFSTVHGAYLSGLRAVNDIKEFYSEVKKGSVHSTENGSEEGDKNDEKSIKY